MRDLLFQRLYAKMISRPLRRFADAYASEQGEGGGLANAKTSYLLLFCLIVQPPTPFRPQTPINLLEINLDMYSIQY